MLTLAGLYLLMVNASCFLSFAYDKHQAITGGWRVAEANLLGLALIGGTPGAFAAQRLFRHKTRKQPFAFQLQLIAVLQLGALAGWGVFGIS